MPLISWATRALQWVIQKVSTSKDEGNLKNNSKSGLKIETHLHEAGFDSNCKSSFYSEHFPIPGTPCPSNPSRIGFKKL